MAAEFVRQGGPAGVPVIQGYATGGWRISGQVWLGAVLVTPDGVTAIAGLGVDGLSSVTSDGVEVLLIGTGATMTRPDVGLMSALRERGVAAEYMDSRAAARTYTMLVNEGRRVAAALLPI